MQVNGPNLNALNTRYSNIFQKSFESQEINWPKVASLVTSTGESETQFWLDRIPQLRQWIGDRQVNNAALLSYILTNLPFELTEGLDKFKVEDNAFGAFDGVVRMMAEAAKKFPDVLVFGPNGVLAKGQNFLTYDGQGYFSTSHPVNVNNPSQTFNGSAVQSNYQASGFPLTAANYGTARQTMRGYVGADGMPLGVRPNLLVVGPDLEATGINILQQEWIAPAGAVGGNAAGALQKNPFYGTADLLIIDDLAYQTGGWWLLDVSGSLKPFIFQLRQAAEFVSRVKPDDPGVFERHEFVYGTSMRGAAGYGPWFKAFKAHS